MTAFRARALDGLLAAHRGVLSFDVFDTLVWRRVPRPVEAFHEIPRVAAATGRDVPSIDPARFANARRRAEAHARRKTALVSGAVEVTLRQIVEELVLALGWPRDEALLGALVEAEVATEAEVLVADRHARAVVAAEAAQGRRLVAVSDTYFSADQVLQLLAAVGYPHDVFERIFVSSEHERGKASGLIDVVLRELAVRPEELLHVGDNIHADVEPFCRAGATGVRWPVAHDRAIELAVQEAGTEALPMRTTIVARDLTAVDGGVTALRARLVAPRDEPDPPADGHERFGRLVYGPVLVGFANWVCQRAEELDVSAIYLFQREGRFLEAFIRQVATVRGQRLRTEVLPVSRAALAPARYPAVTVDYLAERLYGRRARRVGDVFADLGIPDVNLRGWPAERRVTTNEAAELHSLLAGVPGAIEAIGRDLEQRRAGVTRFVRDHLDTRASTVAVVDLGWAGSIQRSLSEALTGAGFQGMVRGLYLATNAGAEAHFSATNHNEGFVADVGLPDGMEPLFRNLEVLEQCALEHRGSVLAYGEDGSVIEAPDDVALSQWQAIARVQDGARRFLEEWAAYGEDRLAPDPGQIEVWRHVARDALLRFCASPSEEEVELFRDWSHDDNKGSRSIERLVPHVFDDAGAAGWVLAEVLAADELLWASAVSASHPPVGPSAPVAIRASVDDAGQGRSVPPLAAVARRSGTTVVAYVGAEAVRFGNVRVALALGPAVVTVQRVTVELSDQRGSVLQRGVVEGIRGRVSRVAADVVVIRGRTFRFRVRISDQGAAPVGPQRVRLLVELEAKQFAPRRLPFIGGAKERLARLGRRTFEAGAPTAARVASRLGRFPRTHRVLSGLKQALTGIEHGPR